MRSSLALLVVATSLATFACKREETTSPDEAATDEPATDEPATDEPATEEPATEEPAARNAETEQVCQHMLELTSADLGDAVTLSPEEQKNALDACYTDLEQKRAAEAPEEFNTKVQCVLAAGTVEQIVACG
jgi:hypothetical protein